MIKDTTQYFVDSLKPYKFQFKPKQEKIIGNVTDNYFTHEHRKYHNGDDCTIYIS